MNKPRRFASVALAASVAGVALAVTVPAHASVEHRATVSHTTPAWASVRAVPANVRRELHITGPATMIVTPQETVILTESGRVIES